MTQNSTESNQRAANLAELRAVLAEQLEIIRLILHLLSRGPIRYKDDVFVCFLEEDKKRATAAVAMGAGQTLGTILRNSSERGIAVRDLYPMARSVVEGFINAAFFVTQPVEVAQRALEHRHYAAWKHRNRVVGTGQFMFSLGTDPDPKATRANKFPAFAGRGQDSWSSLDTPSKIDRIGQSVAAAGGALLGAYAAIYAVSSEIIHGSVYGMSYFMGIHTAGQQSVESFLNATDEQVVDIMSSVGHAASGFIAAFCNHQKMGALVLDEHELFKRLYRAATGDDWEQSEP